ncbi:MAG: ATP-binding protein [Planctomycetota bacterium]
MSSNLRFRVAPHIVEDLGLNLYTSLPRVLAEFAANAYDADASRIDIGIPFDSISGARERIRDLAKQEADQGVTNIEPLRTRTLPTNVKIVLEDDGHGMARDDLAHKFLVAGRRRRKEDGNDVTPKGRKVMGRKGLGKLAGFGAARTVTITSRSDRDDHATRVTMDYDNLLKSEEGASGVEIPTESLSNGDAISVSGTRIELSRLVFDPVKSKLETIEKELAENFEMIDPSDFVISINGSPINQVSIPYAFAYPHPDKPVSDLATRKIRIEDQDEVEIKYRIRFRPEGDALPASRRGVRLYARKRMAMAPSLLDADSNIHGFRQTDYLDGVVHADFIDADKSVDYISTDRRAIRWDDPMLANLRSVLSKEMEDACREYQRSRDERDPKEVDADPFTTKTIEEARLSSRDQRTARRIAIVLKQSLRRGLKDPAYSRTLPPIVKGLGQGNIMTAIHKIAEEDVPDLQKLTVELTRLTADELDRFASYVKTRLEGIEALQRTVREVDFKAKHDEKELQLLLEKSPWLIDPTFSQFLSADEKKSELFSRLANHLGIAEHAPPNSSKERPDLTFLVASESLARLVIVELKAPNKPLESVDLDQLQGYMEDAEAWLRDHSKMNYSIYGELIGSIPNQGTNARSQKALLRRAREAEERKSNWRVRDLTMVLEQTKQAHSELLEAYDNTKLDDEFS